MIYSSEKIELPSNRKFGFLFTLIFFIASLYFYIKEINIFFYMLILISIVFFIISILKADILRPLNKFWMIFGLTLSKAVNPIVLGIIYFSIFTPIGILMRFFGRDELLLIFKKKHSYWIIRDNEIQQNLFRNQF